MTELAYLGAAVLFILGLKQMGSPRTARRGNTLAAIGMFVATLTVLISLTKPSWTVIVAGLVVGSTIGAVLALRVQMTEMPELVAAFNGFGGISSMLVALVALLQTRALWDNETGVTVMLSIVIGAVTFTGSFVAYGKLKGLISGRPISLPGGKVLNATIATAIVILIVVGVTGDATWPYWGAAGLAAVIGVLGVLPIGGADMPVVISLLNSLSGVAASTAGFVIGNDALIIGGALVGAAGMILTLQMGKAMNRTLANVLFSGFGAISSAGVGDGEEKPVNRATPDDVAIALAYAQSVLIVPGYGLAVAQAQHVTKKLATLLEDKGIDVGYAIHPVAGRMPGHMNVLLAEADVPYDQLYDLDQSNPMFQQTDVVLIVGANDVVNPSARDDSTSPIYGMPILEVDRAQTVVVVKRSLSPGFAGIDNPLFYMDSTMMLFSDAKAALENVIKSLEDL